MVKVATIHKDNRAVAISIGSGESILTVDFSDSMLLNKLLHLVKWGRGIQTSIEKEIKDTDSIEDTLDRALALSDITVKYCHEFKDKVEDVFGQGTVEKIFGSALPYPDRYEELFDAIIPLITKYYENSNSNVTKFSKDLMPVDANSTSSATQLSPQDLMTVKGD